MALDIVATPQPATASILLEVSGGYGGATATIVRTDANGTTTVRLRAGQTLSSGALTVTDSEPALAGLVRYEVSTDSPVETATTTATLEGLVAGPAVASVQLPQVNVRPDLVTGYTARREATTSVHYVIGRPDPVPVFGPARMRAGRLDVWCRDYAAAADAAEVLSSAKVLMLRQPDHPGLDMYFVAEAVALEPLEALAEGWTWRVSADYAEVRSPALPLLGTPGWSYGDVAATYSTYSAVRAAFPTYSDLVVGPA